MRARFPLFRVSAWSLLFLSTFVLTTGRGEETRIVRVGVLTDNYPFSFRGDDGQITGFAYELLVEVERIMGLKLERVPGPTSEINPAFVGARLDMLQSFAATPDRESFAEFSFPYLTMAGSILVREGERRIAALADLKGRKVAVHRGSLGEGVLRRAGLADTIVYVESVEQAMVRLDRGEVDATLATRLSGLSLAHRLGLKRVKSLAVDVPGYEVKYCIAVRKGDHRLLAQVNEGLAVMVRTGRFDALREKWFSAVEPRGYTEREIMLAVAAGLTLALLIATWAFARQRSLRLKLSRQAEALRESEERHRAVFEGSREGLLVLGPPDAAGDFPLEQMNPAARRLLRVATGLRGPMSLRGLLPSEVEFHEWIAKTVAERAIVEREYACASGAAWWRISVGPLGRRALVSLVDITADVQRRLEERGQEERRRHAQKLEAIGTLAGGVAHDFNNLLTAIVCNAEMSLLALPPHQPESGYLQQVLRAAGRARQLVKQILTFSRRSEPSRESLKVTPVIEETVNFLRTVARGGVALDYVPADGLPNIVADPAQLHQVLMNIGTNAVQAMQATGGVLTITEEEVDVGEEVRAQHPKLTPGRFVRIGFRDTGPGMSEAVKERIFEPFFTTKAPGEGTGLGLSVVHGIMERHGGAVTVYSQPGRGTLFYLYFPVQSDARADALAADGAPVPEGRGERVLLVDDDAAVVRIVEQVLTRLGYRVTAHTQPLAAWQEFANAPDSFAAVVSDLTMPDCSGLELAARVRELRPGQPFILASGFFSAEEVAGAEATRITHRLLKPFTYAALGRAVAQCVQGNAADPANHAG